MQTGGLGSVIGGAGVDPELPFKAGLINGRKARENGLRLKASVAHERTSARPRGYRVNPFERKAHDSSAKSGLRWVACFFQRPVDIG